MGRLVGHLSILNHCGLNLACVALSLSHDSTAVGLIIPKWALGGKETMSVSQVGTTWRRPDVTGQKLQRAVTANTTWCLMSLAVDTRRADAQIGREIHLGTAGDSAPPCTTKAGVTSDAHVHLTRVPGIVSRVELFVAVLGIQCLFCWLTALGNHKESGVTRPTSVHTCCSGRLFFSCNYHDCLSS